MNTTILVVDDDPSIVNLIKEDLLAEGYNVIVGYDGQTALELARTARPQLIVMDVNMPVFTGPNALEALRRDESTKTIPVLFLTGESEKQEVPIGDARVGQLSKPIDLDSFNTAVMYFLKKFPVA